MFQEDGYNKLLKALDTRIKELGHNTSGSIVSSEIPERPIERISKHKNSSIQEPKGVLVFTKSGVGKRLFHAIRKFTIPFIAILGLALNFQLIIIYGPQYFLSSNLPAISPDNAARLVRLGSRYNLDSSIHKVSISPEGKTIAYITYDCIYLLNTDNGKLFGKMCQDYGGSYNDIQFSPDGNLIISSSNKYLSFWQFRDGVSLGDFPSNGIIGVKVIISLDGKNIVNFSRDFVQLVQVREGGFIGSSLKEYNIDRGYSAAISPNGEILAVGTSNFFGASSPPNGNIQLLNLDDNTSRYLESDTGIDNLAFSPDGHILASVYGGNIKLWNVIDGSITQTLAGGGSSGYLENDIIFSPDGRFLAANSSNHTIRIWQASDGIWKFIKTLEGHFNNSKSGKPEFVFSPNGSVLASASVTFNTYEGI